MTDEIEEIYQQIADAVVSQLPESWESAKVNAIFFCDSSDYEGEYVSGSGKSTDFEIKTEVTRAFKKLRRKFSDSEMALWGQASFELQSSGKFNMKFGYENCDDNGNTIWDEQAWHCRQEERRNRLFST